MTVLLSSTAYEQPSLWHATWRATAQASTKRCQQDKYPKNHRLYSAPTMWEPSQHQTDLLANAHHIETHTKLRVLQSQQPAHPCRCRSCKQGRGRINIDPTAAACCCRAARRLPSYSRHTLLLRWRRSTPAGCCRLLHLLLQTSTALLLLLRLRLAHVIDSQWPVPAGVVGEHLRCLRANGKEA